MSLARTIIGFEWRRYLAAIVVVSLTGLLCYLQAGFVLAKWQSLGAFERELSADIVVLRERPKGLARTSTAPIPLEPENLYVHPAIESVEPFYLMRLVSRTAGDSNFDNAVRAVVVDTRAGAMIYPKTLGEPARELLDVPGSALISRPYARAQGLGIGSTIELRGVSLSVVGVFTAPFAELSNTIVSRKTIDAYLPQFSRSAGVARAALIRVPDKNKIDEIIAELTPWLKKRRLEAIRPEDYVSGIAVALLRGNTSIQSTILVAVFVILVSVMITTQTLRAAVTSLRSQFGTMQALGISQWRISGLTMELALWTGVLGAVLAMTCAFVLQALFLFLDLNMLITWKLVAATTASLLAISLVSGVLCLTFVLSVKPVELLR